MPDDSAFVATPSARACEACSGTHAGAYGSGRFCSATCAKKMGARRKWAAAPRARRAQRQKAPCEGCKRVHDRSYASGRFCSVHCARRVAAARKWDKSRVERSRRLDAIRPAVPAARELAKRRRIPSETRRAPVLLQMTPVVPMYPEQYAQVPRPVVHHLHYAHCPCGHMPSVVLSASPPQHVFYPPGVIHNHAPVLQDPNAAPRVPFQGVSYATEHPVHPHPQQQPLPAPLLRVSVPSDYVSAGQNLAPVPPVRDQPSAEGDASEALLCLGAPSPADAAARSNAVVVADAVSRS